MLLLKPRNRFQEIAYQTTLPYYHPQVIEEYERISPGAGEKLLEILTTEVKHLTWSREQYPQLTDKEWEDTIAGFGWNIYGFKYPSPPKGNS